VPQGTAGASLRGQEGRARLSLAPLDGAHRRGDLLRAVALGLLASDGLRRGRGREAGLLCGQTEIYPKEPKGTQKIRYRHYLSELAKKPKAVRQVAPELIRELGEPYGKLWEMLDERYGPKEASRVLARILGAVADHGEEAVAEAVDAALSRGRLDLLSLAEHLHERDRRASTVAVPQALSGYRVESANASEYDRLLGADAAGGAL
jgi:hypothetical protein